MKQSIIALAVFTACAPVHIYANTIDLADNTSTEVVTVIGTPLSLSTQNIEQESVSATSNIDADFGDQLATLPGVSISRNGPVTGLCLLYTSPSPRDRG